MRKELAYLLTALILSSILILSSYQLVLRVDFLNLDRILSLQSPFEPVVAAEKPETNKTYRFLIQTVAIKTNFWFQPLSIQNRMSYIHRHPGYELRMIENTDMDRQLNINWVKIYEARRSLNSTTVGTFEWIHLSDLDLFYMNMSIGFEQIIYDIKIGRIGLLNSRYFNVTKRPSSLEIVVAVDGYGINFGSVLIKNSSFVRQVLDVMWSKRRDFKVPGLAALNEQAVFVYLCTLDSTWRARMADRVAIVSQKVLNSYSWTKNNTHYKYQPGDFAIHFAGPQKKFVVQYKSIISNMSSVR